MDENGVPRIASSFYCPLTMTVMKDPVQDREGNSYERGAIMRWLETKDTSPITRNKLKWRHLTPNRALREAIEFEEKRRQRLLEKRQSQKSAMYHEPNRFHDMKHGSVIEKVINECLSEMKINARLDSWGIAFVPMNKLKQKLNMLMVIEALPSRDIFRLCTHVDAVINNTLSTIESDCNRVLRDLIQCGKHGSLTLKKVNNSMRFCFEGKAREITTTQNFRDILFMFVEVAFRMKRKLEAIASYDE
mmetsp:Transcript_1450/g.3208  ORF Transcript_1450/g.3208 Transcript_1450/m.3208 type:complete len:247 (-) Transcript_1450:1663-2403(-)